jgi:hypothetical protein
LFVAYLPLSCDVAYRNLRLGHGLSSLTVLRNFHVRTILPHDKHVTPIAISARVVLVLGGRLRVPTELAGEPLSLVRGTVEHFIDNNNHNLPYDQQVPAVQDLFASVYLEVR